MRLRSVSDLNRSRDLRVWIRSKSMEQQSVVNACCRCEYSVVDHGSRVFWNDALDVDHWNWNFNRNDTFADLDAVLDDRHSVRPNDLANGFLLRPASRQHTRHQQDREKNLSMLHRQYH